MASNITLSAGVKQNLLSLQNTASLMATTQNRLATGKKVNSALDNPTNFFTSQSLQSRAGDLNSLLDSMSNGIKTLEAADNGLSAITKTVESMQSTLRQARQDKSFKTSSYTIDGTTIGSAATKNITFSGGAVGTTGVSVQLNDLAVNAVQGTVTAANSSYVAPAAATAATFTATNVYTDIDVSTNGADEISFDITDGTTSTSVTLGQGAAAGGDNVYDIDEAIAEIQDQLDAGGTNVTVGKDVAGTRLTFTSTATGAGASVTVDNVAVAGGGSQAITDLGIANPGTTGETDTGGAAGADKAISINGVNITLTAANAATATDAASVINAALDAANIDITATGNNTDGTIDLAGPADGSVDITLGGADQATVFGAAPTAVAAVEGVTGGAKTVDELVTAINNTTALQGKVRASNDNGKLRIENQSTSDLTVAGIGSTDGELDGSAGTASIGGNEARTKLVSQFNDLRDQLDKLADDASFNGVNLLRGDLLKLTFNETGTSSINIQTEDGDAVNSAFLGITDAQASEFDSDTSLDAKLATLGDALTNLRSQASTFGSNLSIVQNRQDFTKNMIATLQTGADNLVLADTNEEAANMLALQTRQQLSSTALSLASQADQAALRLF
jgi:flagellin